MGIHKSGSGHTEFFDHHSSSESVSKHHDSPRLDDNADSLFGRTFDQSSFEFAHFFGGNFCDHREPAAAPGTQLAIFAGNGDPIELVPVPPPTLLSEAGAASGTGTAPGAGGTALVANAAASPFVINVTYDASVAAAPAAFKTVVNAVVQYFESQFTDPVTININVGYGEAGGSSLGGALGMSLTYLTNTTYAGLRSALIADAKTADDTSAVNALSAIDPTGTNSFWLATAQAKALGLATPAVPADGFIGFSNTAAFDYDNSNGVTAGQADFYGVVAHELSEAMGRFLLVGSTIGTGPSYDALDLMHYSAAGVRDLVGTTAGYASINGGTTKLYDFNTNSGGDFGDWAASAGSNSFLAFANAGVVLPVTASDLKVMDAIGWDAVQTSSPPPPPPPPPPVTHPDLTVSSLSLHDTTVNFQIHNSGTAASVASTTGIYLSTDSAISTSDILIATVATPALAVNGSSNGSVTVSLPGTLVPGTYFIGAVADTGHSNSELSETNNASTTAARVIVGSSGNNVLTGTTAADTIIALGGNDTLVGGLGNDTLIGGSGADHFRINATNEGRDLIADFSSADSLDFSRAAFGNGLAIGGASLGTLSSSHFASNSTGSATAATAQFIYNTSTHILSYDSNGTGAGGAIQLAQLENGFAIGSGNIHLV